jgi:hypothetical protein
MEYDHRYTHTKRKKEYVTASITVEAAFILPLVIFTVLALIYLAFYLHDTCKIQNQVDYTLHQAGLSLKHETDILTGQIKYEEINNRGIYDFFTGNTASEETLLQTELEDQLSKGLLLMKITEITVAVEKFSLSINVKAVCQVALPIWKKLFSSMADIMIRGDYPIHDPAETIRRCEVILNTAEQIKGVDQIKEKIEKFLGKKE